MPQAMTLSDTSPIALIGAGALARALGGGALAAERTVLGVHSRHDTCPLADELGVAQLDVDAAMKEKQLKTFSEWSWAGAQILSGPPHEISPIHDPPAAIYVKN